MRSMPGLCPTYIYALAQVLVTGLYIYVLSSMCCLLCTVLCVVRCVLCVVRCVLCIVCYAVHCALCMLVIHLIFNIFLSHLALESMKIKFFDTLILALPPVEESSQPYKEIILPYWKVFFRLSYFHTDVTES